MKNSIYLNFILLACLNSTSLQVYAEQAAAPPGKIVYEDRIQFVQTLLDKSSATKQIDASGNADAIERRNVARTHFELAKVAHGKGDLDTANEELIEATKIMFDAVRLAKKDEVVEEKKRRDYQDRLNSINALMEAHGRVSQEKHKEGKELDLLVAEKVSNANALLKAGELDRARVVLDEAYVAAKIAINTLRSGDTLVRSLNFETKEDEYNYEIDRNNTHQMLIKILMKDHVNTPGTEKMVQEFMDKATALRQEAEKQAAAGNHETAIKTLEESTKNLVRALRGAGIYIPG